MNILAKRKPEVTYASIEMIRYMMNPRREIGSNIDRLAARFEEMDSEAKESHRIAGKYMRKVTE